MDTLQRTCAGLDVHKDTVVACVRWLDDRDRVHTEVRTFGTTTPGVFLDVLDDGAEPTRGSVLSPPRSSRRGAERCRSRWTAR